MLVNGGFDPFQYVELPHGYTAAPSGASKGYRLLSGSYTWQDARQACEDEGARLVMPKTTEDLDDIRSHNSELQMLQWRPFS